MEVEAERDLGIWVTSDLTWSKQVCAQSSAANRLLGCVRRGLMEVRDTCVRRTIYLAIVRPHLGYSTQVWSPQLMELMRKIERVQRRATKFILNLSFRSTTNYKDRLIQLKLLPLSYWHEYLDLVFFFKLVNNLVPVDPAILPSEQTYRSTRNTSNPDLLIFRVPKCRTTTYQQSYFPRTCRTWNILPAGIRRRGLSLCSFKSFLRRYYVAATNQCYDPEDPRTWKSICGKCNTPRPLVGEISCCS